MIKDQPIEHFLDALASKAPAPGGGSAAAIMGAMGAALVGMVGNLTVGKKNYEAVEDEMRAMLAQAEDLRARLTDLIRADVEAFNQVMGAYGLPKDTDAQKQARTEAIQAALKTATDVPLDCARACAEIVRLSRIAAEKGNRNVVSDAGAAVAAGYAALRCSALNVHVNVGSIKDGEFVASRLAELDRIMAGMEETDREVYALVKGKL
ncbi:methenyltetrahydrofolate cyclohydrolase [Methylomagnum ishizawai]|uniref:methenyltetrahydrofolate cyclohydrolase n=1 Tax=Methylomagnum ishizawai TaxID=1760988 RepID=UPI001C334659|nr:methenyltetrahydrofolate cyclohydrolase [Methylomagnum ishizawai]BBL74907.1 sugar ABC transporter substrate-binding protein [Methylomagnum ishizawai]